MTKSTKLGVFSLLLLASMFVPPYADWREPINVSCAVLSCVLALLAAVGGRKIWLVIPCVIGLFAAILLFVGLRAY